MGIEDVVNRRAFGKGTLQEKHESIKREYERSIYAKGKDRDSQKLDFKDLLYDARGEPADPETVMKILHAGEAKDIQEIRRLASIGVIGGYYPIKEHGQGAAFDVYKAMDSTGQVWAMKVRGGARPSLLKKAGIKNLSERMYRNRAASMASEHIADMIVLEHKGKDYFIERFMPYTLKDEIEDGIPRDLGIEYVRQLGEAVRYCHAHNVWHRDIKPDNIGVSNGRIMLFDFSHSQDITIHDPTRREIGGLLYRSPELYSDGNFRAQSDIFSMCAVDYEIITGSNPIKAYWLETYGEPLKVDFAPTALRTSSAERIMSVLTADDYPERIIPPLTKALGPYQSLANLIGRGLHKDPQKRSHQDQARAAKEFYNALQKALRETPNAGHHMSAKASLT